VSAVTRTSVTSVGTGVGAGVDVGVPLGAGWALGVGDAVAAGVDDVLGPRPQATSSVPIRTAAARLIGIVRIVIDAPSTALNFGSLRLCRGGVDNCQRKRSSETIYKTPPICILRPLSPPRNRAPCRPHSCGLHMGPPVRDAFRAWWDAPAPLLVCVQTRMLSALRAGIDPSALFDRRLRSGHGRVGVS
jgi:hypothetical protein